MADTDYVTRFAQQQSTAALNTYNQYVRDTVNPAETRFRDASSSVTAAAQAYNTFAADRSTVDAAASAAKQVYDASVQQYQGLQAAYQDLEPQLTEYTRQAEAAKQQVLSLQGMAPELQRSLAIDTEARKRGTRLGYRRPFEPRLQKGVERHVERTQGKVWTWTSQGAGARQDQLQSG